MRVRPHQAVGKEKRLAVLLCLHDDRGKKFEIDLVHDPGCRGHDAEAVEGVFPPAQKLVTLAVARELDFRVPAERERRSEHIDLHRVVDDEIHRDGGVDAFRVAA